MKLREGCLGAVENLGMIASIIKGLGWWVSFSLKGRINRRWIKSWSVGVPVV